LRCVDACQPQFCDESILKDTKNSLHSSLGLRGKSKNRPNTQYNVSVKSGQN
jgi:hypothetical protein